jgi:hypothetical protein
MLGMTIGSCLFVFFVVGDGEEVTFYQFKLLLLLYLLLLVFIIIYYYLLLLLIIIIIIIYMYIDDPVVFGVLGQCWRSRELISPGSFWVPRRWSFSPSPC